MSILVTGGAGYIGSVVTERLVDRGYSVVVLDNLSEGHQESVHPAARLYIGSVGDQVLLKKIFTENNIEATIHLAGYIQVGESVLNPQKYFNNNFELPKTLVQEGLSYGVKNFIFSSTAAVYGIPESIPIKEIDNTKPINPYGQSKLNFEQYLFEQAQKGLQYSALRYFNACGATENYGEMHNTETHLIPLILDAAYGRRPSITVYGTDYPTFDGTCVRDYVHVQDIADAHILILELMLKKQYQTSVTNMHANAYNLGNGQGFSVKEILEAVRKTTNRQLDVAYGPRREGDPAVLVADSTKIKALGWNPKHSDLGSIIGSAARWHKHRLL